MMSDHFTGFYNETFGFLAGLVHNNDRAWFEAHRADYERFVLEPALALITALHPIVQEVSPYYRGVAKKSGGSLMRIYRDTRFAHDKTPYKTNIGIQLRHADAADIHAPGYYIHLDLEQTFVGAGTWHPEPADLLNIRRRIAAKPNEFQRAVDDAQKRHAFVVDGESLVKVPRGFDAGHPLVNELKRKDFFLSENLAPDLFFSRDLVEALASRIRAASPYMRFLCQALDAPF